MMVTDFSPVTLGRQVKCLVAGDFVITEAANKPLAVLPRHAHELASITFVLRGFCEETIGARPQKCVPHSAIIKPAGEFHSNRYSDTRTDCLIIEVRPDRLQSIHSFSRTLDYVQLMRSDWIASFATRIYREFKIGDTASLLSIEGLVLEVLGYATRGSSKSSPFVQPLWLVKAKEMCHEQFDQSISLLGISETVGVHPAHLARMFRRHFQCTVGEYLRRVRLNHAARELTRSGKSVAQIASESGFYDQSHFTHTFKLHMGTTPTEYRSETQESKGNTNQTALPESL